MKLQARALERRGLVVLTDSKGRQRGYAPEAVAKEVRRRERTAAAARTREAAKRERAPRAPRTPPRRPTWRTVESTSADLGEPSDAALVVQWTYEAAQRHGPGRLEVEVATTVFAVEVPDHLARGWRSDLVAALLDLLAGADPAALAVRADVLRRQEEEDEDEDEDEEEQLEDEPTYAPATGGRGDTPNQPRPSHSYPTRVIDGELVIPPGWARVLRLALAYQIFR